MLDDSPAYKTGIREQRVLFPVLDAAARIEWWIAECAYLRYVALYGSRVSLERIADRGGFSIAELNLYLPGWREMD